MFPAIKWHHDTGLSLGIAGRRRQTMACEGPATQSWKHSGTVGRWTWGHIPQAPPLTSRGRVEKSPTFPRAAFYTYKMGVTGILPSQNRYEN